MDWSEHHKDLFQILNQSPFCPSQSYVAPSHKQRPNSGPNASKDKKGRQRISFKCKDICKKGRTRMAYPFDHICIKCKKTGHSQGTCHSNSAPGSESSNSAGPRNNPKPSK